MELKVYRKFLTKKFTLTEWLTRNTQNKIIPEWIQSWCQKQNEPCWYYRRLHSRKAWYKNGKLHREDGPAIEWDSGDKEWWVNGIRHREDGPAIEASTGNYWYVNGKLHRENAPAIAYADGDEIWCINGKKHREDGPAVIMPPMLEWWIDGKLIKYETYLHANR